MKYLMCILLIPVFFISELIEGLTEEEIWNLQEVQNFKMQMKRSMELIEEMRQDPRRLPLLLNKFEINFRNCTSELRFRLPMNYQDMLKRYESMIENSVAVFENAVRSGGNRVEAIKQFKINVEKSMLELKKVELYPGKYYRLKAHFASKFHSVNLQVTRNNTEYSDECAWHYRYMKKNDNIECELATSIEEGKAFVDEATDYGKIMDEVPICHCWKLKNKLRNKDKKKILAVLEVFDDHQEFVFTLTDVIEDSKYIFTLNSGWQNIHEFMYFQ